MMDEQQKSRKGVPNKAKAEFREALRAYAKKHHVEPHYWMVDLLADTTEVIEKVLDEQGSVHEIRLPRVSIELKFKAASELAQYLEPKLRSMLVEGNPASPLTVLQALPDTALDALISRHLREGGYDGGHAMLPEPEAML